MDAFDVVKVNYIKELLEKGQREDSRELMQYRKISITPNLIENAEGSAQVDLGNTRVLAGVKIQLEEPMGDTPDRGNMSVSAELLPLASPNYEMGPPSPDSIELARVVDRGIRAGECVDLKSLLVEEGKCWSVYVDVYVLNYDGNLFDAAELAAMTALYNARVPKYENGEAVMAERTQKLKIDNVVTSTTFAKVGKTILLDVDKNEEDAADARLTIATDGKLIRAMQKGKGGSFSKKELEDMVDISFNKHEELKSYIEGAK